MEEYTTDGVHANKAGYKVMSDLAEQAIKESLSRSKTKQQLFLMEYAII